METLPIELQRLIITGISRSELLQLCTINKQYSHLCKDELLWRQLVYTDFGPNSDQLSNSWFTTYKIYHKFSQVWTLGSRSIGNNNWTIVGVYASKKDAICALINDYINSITNTRILSGYFRKDVLSRYPDIDSIWPNKDHPLRSKVIEYIATLVMEDIIASGENIVLAIDYIYYRINNHTVERNLSCLLNSRK